MKRKALKGFGQREERTHQRISIKERVRKRSRKQKNRESYSKERGGLVKREEGV